MRNYVLRTELVERMEKLGTAALDLLEANEIKDRFLGMAAHDLRNPINVVRMMSEMLTSMKLEDETKQEFYKDINRNALHMLSLINDLLDVSAIASGTVQLKLTQNNIRSGIKDCVRMQQMTAQAKDITLVMEDTEMPDSVFDADRIGQGADNLISNAVKYSPAGTEVQVSFEADKNHVQFSVGDEGPGIPENELDKLFQEFAKVSTQPTAWESSTGLGLSIVKKIVDSHKGTIDVDSQVGHGTKFTVALPPQFVRRFQSGRALLTCNLAYWRAPYKGRGASPAFSYLLSLRAWQHPGTCKKRDSTNDRTVARNVYAGVHPYPQPGLDPGRSHGDCPQQSRPVDRIISRGGSVA